MSKVDDAANHVWLEFYLACIEDRITWRALVKMDDIPDMFSGLRESNITSRNIIMMGVESLAEKELVSISTDDFEERYVRLTNEGFSRADREIDDSATEIGRIFAERKLREFLADNNTLADSAPTEDEWKPIPVDRTAPTFEQAMSSLEAVRDQFRQENGFASEEPEKKAALVDALDKGIDVLRSQVLTRATLDALIIRPLNSLVKIFGTATIGEAAKIALAALRTWLGW